MYILTNLIKANILLANIKENKTEINDSKSKDVGYWDSKVSKYTFNGQQRINLLKNN